MSLLTIVSDAARELSLPVPTAVIAATDPQALLLLRCAKAEGKALASRHAWQAMLTEHTFTTVAAAAQTSSIPSDFDRIVPESMFNRTTPRKVWGPVDSAEWQSIQASLVTRVDPAFRIRLGTIYMTPTPSADQTVAYEYVSTKWCQSSGGTAQTNWAADTDIPRIGIDQTITEEVITLGVIWRFRKSRGLEYEADRETHARAVLDLIMRDGARPTLTLDPIPSDRVPRAPQVPETLVF